MVISLYSCIWFDLHPLAICDNYNPLLPTPADQDGLVLRSSLLRVNPSPNPLFGCLEQESVGQSLVAFQTCILDHQQPLQKALEGAFQVRRALAWIRSRNVSWT